MLIYCKMEFIPVIKGAFSASLLQSSVSHDPSEYADLLLKKHLWLLSMLKTIFMQKPRYATIQMFVFDRINTGLVSRRDLKIVMFPNFWQVLHFLTGSDKNIYSFTRFAIWVQ